MKTKIQLKQTITLRYPANRMNIAQITNMQARLYPLITQSGKEIILDLRNVLFMDCCAAGYLISMSRIARSNHTRLTLINLTPNVQLLTDTLKLSKIINIPRKRNNNIQNIISNDTQIVNCTHLF